MIQNASHFIWREGFVDSFELETACPHWLCNCARTRGPLQCLFVNSRAPGLSGRGHQSPCSAPSWPSMHSIPLVSRLSWNIRYQVVVSSDSGTGKKAWTHGSRLLPASLPNLLHQGAFLGICRMIISMRKVIWVQFRPKIQSLNPSESESYLVMSDSLQPHRLWGPWNSPGQNTGVGSLSLLKRIFLIQGSNPGLPHCGQILY